MSRIQKLIFDGALPKNFFSIADKVYEGLSFRAAEGRAMIEALFLMESARNEIIIYTNDMDIRLVGIFPHKSTEVFFGFWEGLDDVSLHTKAFNLLESDAKEKGRTMLTGPVNFNTFHQYRLRLGEPPGWLIFDREPVNPTYYPTVLEAIGFTATAQFQSRLIKKERIPDLYLNKTFLLENLSKLPFSFISLNVENWVKYEDEIFELIEIIFSQNSMYKSISKEQFQLLYNKTFARKLCPYSSVLFQDDSGKLAAISLCHPNYSELYTSVTAPCFEKDFNRLHKKTLLVKTVGVHPQYRRQKLMSYLGAYAMQSFRDKYDEVLFCLMRNDNHSLHFSDNLPYERAMYAVYQKHLS